MSKLLAVTVLWTKSCGTDTCSIVVPHIYFLRWEKKGIQAAIKYFIKKTVQKQKKFMQHTGELFFLFDC